MTKVVNIHLDEYDVYIGRAGHGHDGYFGNPFRIWDSADIGASLGAFKDYFLRRIAIDNEFRRRVLELKGKTLGCFCAPKGGLTGAKPHVCHGQIIAEWLEQAT